MKTYTRNYKRISWGFAIVKAESLDDARDRFDTDDADDYLDNKSEIEWEEPIKLKED